MDELEVFICKAFKGTAIVVYCKPLLTPQMETSGLSASGGLALWVKINERK